MSGVALKNVVKKYGETQVIHGVELDVEDGEFCVFVGPSGCGKSTLLRMIAGLEETTSGAINIGSRDVTRLDPSERGVSMVFQTYALYPHMTVKENMGFGLKMNGHPKAEIEAKVAEASRILKLDDYLSRKPAALSGGQRQRVSIGRAIVRGPEVFLFDEPLSNLDAELRVEMRVEIARLHKEIGATMIYVTHDQVEAMTLADKIVVLRAGRVEQVGRPMDLYNDPDNTFVAGFIGSPQMNFLKAGLLGLQSDTLGIRPEHLTLAGTDGQNAGQIAGRVSHVERLGGETLVYISTEAHGLLTLRQFGQHHHAVESAVTLSFDPAQALHFDAEGRRLR